MSEYMAMLWNCVCSIWDWLGTTGSNGATSRESPSTTIRNLGLVIAAAIALPLAVWRSKIAGRQASIAQQDLLNGRCQTGAEMLGSEFLSVRLGGSFALDRIADEHPEQYHFQVMELFCAFVRHPNGSADNAAAPIEEEASTSAAQFDEGYQEGALNGEQEPRIRQDVQAIMDLLHQRSDKRVALEEKSGFKPDLRGAYLRHAILARTRLDRAVFANADLSYSRLKGASLRNAILRDTKLTGAKLSKANLCGATLAGADLSDAMFENTNLSGTRLSDPESGMTVHGLTQTQLDQAYADSFNSPVLEGAIDATTRNPLTWRN